MSACKLQLEIERCHREIAEIERLLMGGHPDVPGLCMALGDWSAELQILQNEQRRQGVKPGGAREAGVGVDLRGDAVGPILILGAEGLDLQPELLGERALTNPRTVWACQPVAFMISASVAPCLRRSRSRTSAFLLPSRASAAPCLAREAFFGEVAFLPVLSACGVSGSPCCAALVASR